MFHNFIIHIHRSYSIAPARNDKNQAVLVKLRPFSWQKSRELAAERWELFPRRRARRSGSDPRSSVLCTPRKTAQTWFSPPFWTPPAPFRWASAPHYQWGCKGNVTVRLILTTQEELNRGVNKLSTQFEKQATYNSIRGVRYFKIDGEDATDFSGAINKEKNCIISLYILGTNESGITYSSVKRYGNKDIKNGYEFISIRKSEYEKQINNASFITQKNNFRRKRVANRDSFRYQHFDRICELDEHGKIKNTLPGKRSLPIKETMLNFVSWVISLVLDK